MNKTQHQETQKPISITHNIASLGKHLSYADLPVDVVTIAKHCLLDWLGVTLAATHEEAVDLLRSVLCEQGGKPEATLLGTEEKSSKLNAAIVNGIASHALDFDDLHVPAHLPDGAIGHPSAPVIGALLPLAEAQNLDGRAFIAAFVAGIEVECRVGLAVAPDHYATGWHSTATIGTFGAAAACAHALQLNETGWLNTLGLAGMQAQGLKSMFGTMAKPFQVGKAAGNGLLAALLADRGYTSNQQIIEDEQGFGRTQSSRLRVELPNTSDYLIRQTRFKKYACCGGTHPTIEAALSLVQKHRLKPQQIKHVVVQVHPSRDKACNITNPQLPLEGKFSLAFVTALALTGSDLTEKAFTEQALNDSALSALQRCVKIELAPSIDEVGSRVRIELHNGSKLEAYAAEGGPETNKEQEWRDLTAKFAALATPFLGPNRCRQTIEAVSHLEDLRLTKLVALLTPMSND